MVIQAALFFILGIAVITFVLILIAPFVWRRMMFFARKIWRARLPASIREVEADKNFLRAQHAVQMARQEERYKLLQRINDEQQRQLERNQQQLQRLNEIEGQTDSMHKQVLGYKNLLQTEQEKVDNVLIAHGQSSKEVRDLFFREKLTRLDVASYEANLHDLHKKIDDLHKNYASLYETKAAEPFEATKEQEENFENATVLRDELKNLVATIISNIVQKDEEIDRLIKITAKNKKQGSLADYIHKKLTVKQRQE